MTAARWRCLFPPGRHGAGYCPPRARLSGWSRF